MLWILDLDGVVWLAGRPINGSAEAVAALRRRGERVVFTTNNSFFTVSDYVAELGDAGIAAEPDDVVTSAQAAAALVAEGSCAWTCAGPGVSEALAERAVTEVRLGPEGSAPPDRADALVVGFHLDFGYRTLSTGAQAIRDGAAFVGTNDDATYPTPTGLWAGTGALLAAFATASGRRPTVAGKPHEPIVDLVSARFGVDGGPCTVVGDRPSTDGLFARRLGATFVLVDSGVTAPGTDPETLEVAPDLRGPDLAAVVRATA